MGYASPLMSLAQVAVREAFGDPVTYTQGTSSVSCVGIYRREAVTVLDQGGAPVDTWREVIDFREDDLEGLVARTKDTIVRGSSIYTVTHVERGPVGVVVCTIGRAS